MSIIIPQGGPTIHVKAYDAIVSGPRCQFPIWQAKRATVTRGNRLLDRCSEHPKGVFCQKDSDKYCARIGFNREQIIIGYYDDPTEAARVYDRKAKELLDQFGTLSFAEDR